MATSKKIKTNLETNLSQENESVRTNDSNRTTSSEEARSITEANPIPVITIARFKNLAKEVQFAMANEVFKENPSMFLQEALDIRTYNTYQPFLKISDDVIKEVDIITQQTISSYSTHIEPLLNS